MTTPISFERDFELGYPSKHSTIEVGSDTTTGARYALKTIKPNTHLPADGEATIHQRVSGHPNIVPVVESRCDGTVLLLPYYEHGDLFTWQSSHYPAGLPLHLLKSVGRQVASALAHCHELGVIHRDIKGENVFVVAIDPITVRLADFGLSWYGPLLRSIAPTETVGTPSHMPPEIIRMDGQIYGSAVDVWSFGVMMYEMLYPHAPPFEQMSYEDDSECSNDDDWIPSVRHAVLHKQPKYWDGPDGIFKPWNDLLRACLSKDANDRPTMEQIMKSPALCE